MSKRRMSFESDQDGEGASNSRERKLPRRNPNLQQEAPIPANPNPEEGEAPIPEEEGQIQAQELLFEKKLRFTEATCSGKQLVITGAHKATVMAFLSDAERARVVDGGLRVATTDPNHVEYTLLLKRATAGSRTYLSNGWAAVARANKVKEGDSVQGIGSRAGGHFRLHLNIIKPLIQDDDTAS